MPNENFQQNTQNVNNMQSGVLSAEGLSPDFVERFFHAITQTDTCWLWNGAADDHGTGRIGKSGIRRDNNVTAPRAAWFLANGDNIKSFIMKGCPFGVPNCVRPNHIRLPGTPRPTEHIPLSDVQRERIEILC